jgi:hypothetical protein
MFFLQTYWRKVLSAKRRNMRQHRDRNLSEVVEYRDQQIKRKATAVTDPSNVKKSRTPAHGLKLYLASRPLGEDDTSIRRHIANMKAEHKKRIKDHRTIDLGMDKTFGDRRQWVVYKNPTISEIKETYPCLFNSMQVTI